MKQPSCMQAVDTSEIGDATRSTIGKNQRARFQRNTFLAPSSVTFSFMKDKATFDAVASPILNQGYYLP